MKHYGARRVTKMMSEVNALRDAIRAHDQEATEAAWERVAQWLDLNMLSLIENARLTPTAVDDSRGADTDTKINQEGVME